MESGIQWLRRLGGCGLWLAAVVTGLLLGCSCAQAAFGIASFSTSATNADGTLDLQAGSHPFAYSFRFAMNEDTAGRPEGGLRAVEVDLPAGLFGNPGAVSRCSSAEFDDGANCPIDTQVGLIEAAVSGLGEISIPLFNLAPPPGYVASFGGSVEGNGFIELLSLDGSGHETHLRVTVSRLPLGGDIRHVVQTLWGVPADREHDAERGTCLFEAGSCPASGTPAALLTLPARCDGSPVTTLTVTSAEIQARQLVATAQYLDQGRDPHGLVGCDALPFAPTLTISTDPGALSPTGLDINLDLPLSEQAYGSATPSIRELTLVLPPGLAINPAVASGLVGCSPGQIGLDSDVGQPARFNSSPTSCPGAAAIGTVSARLPSSLGEALSGTVYLASPGHNPYAAPFAFYIVLEDPARGLLIKVPARFAPDPASGRLTAVVSDLPELPFAGIRLRFPSGPLGLFAAPPDCGTYAATADLVPSTTPEGTTAHAEGEFRLVSGPGGSACPSPEYKRPVPSALEAGTLFPAAGFSSPFVLRLTRSDLDQHFGSFALTLPPGLLGDLGSTPLGTKVGSVQVEAGVGSVPMALEGAAYLSGPYSGGPYSLETVVPAGVGPFDLGTIVQRAALEVDPVTAQVSVRSDPLPQILGGVPLAVRDIRIDLDRPGFIRNPTSCEPMAITGTTTTSLGQQAPIADRFQVGGCAALPFKPRLSLALSGAAGRGGHPAVRAVYRGDPEGATPSGISFWLPAGELLDVRHLGRLCPREVGAERCPRGSRLGTLRIDTPMLDAPLEGPIYLRVPSGRLPGLTAEVRSGGLRFLLRGRVTGRGGRLGVSLESLPDVPLSKAVLTLPGGRRGLVVNSESLCAGSPGAATASFSAHSGKQRRLRVPVRLGDRC